MIERRNTRLQPRTTAENVSQRIDKLEARQKQRQRIREFIEAGQWGEALNLAQIADIFIFDDPIVVKQFPGYLHQQIQTSLANTQAAAAEAARRAEEAEASYERALQALTKTEEILAEQAVMEAFLLADEALRKLDSEQLAEQMRLIEQMPYRLSESQLKKRLGKLLNDQRWLNNIDENRLQAARESPIEWNILIKDLSLYDSRLAYLREETKQTAQFDYISKFASLVPILREGDIERLQANLSSLENKIKDDSQSTLFERMTYLEIASIWHQRASHLEILQNKLTKIEKECQGIKELFIAPDHIRKNKNRKIIESHFIRHLEWLQIQSQRFSPELFAIQDNYHQTIGTRWRQTTKEVIGIIWICRYQVDEDSQQDTWVNHTLWPTSWQNRLSELEEIVKNKEGRGNAFFLQYQAIGGKFENFHNQSINSADYDYYM